MNIAPKFAPGDEICITNTPGFEYYNNGDKGIIKAHDSRIDMPWWKVTFENGETWIVDESEMELSKVVDSPLWKALK